MAETDEDADLPEKPEEDGPLPAYSTADFHNVVQKHVLNALYETMIDTKLQWSLVAPFVEAARELCRADFQEAGEIRLHTVQADGDGWVDADEAYLGISVADRDDGQEWLTETLWLSDIAIAEEDPEQVRAIVRGLERTIGKLNAWLAEQEGGADGAAPPDSSAD